MTRPDLGLKFDGWQTSDPTPQETSEGDKEDKKEKKLKVFVKFLKRGQGTQQ